MAKPEQDVARTERIMVRLTEDERAYVENRGWARSRKLSGLKKVDGSLNLSAAIRHIILDGYKGSK